MSVDLLAETNDREIIGKMSKVIRSVKNVTKGYSSVQVKVRNGKSFKRCDASSTIADLFSHSDE